MKQLHLTLIALVLSFASFAAIGPITSLTGTISACPGTLVGLSNSTAGGTWSSGTPAVATINASTGTVTGLTVGTTNITYITSSGVAYAILTINPLPAPLSGPSAVCIGTPTPYSCTTPGGLWTTSNVSILSVGNTTGLAIGITYGSTIISYYLPTGCASTQVVSVNPVPAAIGGTTVFCVGSSTTLTNATTGGTWSSSATGVASIDAVTGVTSGLSSGTSTISYTISTGCAATQVITVNPIPSAITGPTTVCFGTSVTLADVTTGGTWSSSSPAIATVSSTGVITTVAPGIALIAYTAPLTGCAATTLLTITDTAHAGPISGPSIVCTTNTISLTGFTPGGTWSSSNPAVATVNAAGLVTGITAGTANIVYIMPASCGSSVASLLVTVTTIASAGTLSGTMSACAGATTILNSTVAGGTWTSSTPAVGTVDLSTGIVTGIAAGTTTITYTITMPCGTAYAVSTVTINPSPTITISGASTICIGGTTTVTATPAYGTWSGGTPIASVDMYGEVTGLASGGAIITYLSLTGCMSTILVTVAPATSAGTLSGPTLVCIGGTITIGSTVGGGTWSMTNSRATVSAGGVVTGVTAGLDTVKYTVSTTCGVAVAMWGVNVSATSSAGSITGTATTCVGLTTTLSNIVTGGTWSSSNPAIATVTPASGIVSGITAGTAVITYSVSMSCGVSSTNTVVTVTPTAGTIAGTVFVCAGSTSTLVSAPVGGTWASSTPAVASIDMTTGVLTGHTSGITTISYVLAGGCLVTRVITVNPLPTITTTATAAACGGLYTVTAAGGLSYSWAPSTAVSCPACAVSSVDPALSATYTVSGTDANGCLNTAIIAVNNNRIYGHILYSGVIPADQTTKVWLIKYNSTDSSITDSANTISCMDAGVPYYEFNGKAAGNYLIKAKLVSSVAGTSDYIPTYGTSNSSWFTATNVAHGTTSDIMNVSMLYGTVPSGPGFISGFVYSGAGKGTSGSTPVAGMLILLRNAFTWEVLTYTYTDAAGAYSFSGIGTGVSVVVYPEDYKYYTTPSAIMTIGSPYTSLTNVTFKQGTTSHTIKPITLTGVAGTEEAQNVLLYPNPTTGVVNIQWAQQLTGTAKVTVTDMLGRIVYSSEVSINAAAGNTQADLSSLKKGMYFINIKGEQLNYSSKLQIQ